MPYLNSILQPGEVIVHFGRIHWITYVPGVALIAVGLVLLIDGLGPRWILGHSSDVEVSLAALILVIGLGSVGRARFLQWTTELAVTNRRVIQKSGLLTRRTAEMNINQVERVEVTQSILGRILNYGTIGIHGSGLGLESLNSVADPLALRSSITAR